MGSDGLDSHTLYICGSKCRVLWRRFYQRYACCAHSLEVLAWYWDRVRISTRALCLRLTKCSGEYPAGSVACAESTGELKEGHRNRWFIMFTNVQIDIGFVASTLAPMRSLEDMSRTRRHSPTQSHLFTVETSRAGGIQSRDHEEHAHSMALGV